MIETDASTIPEPMYQLEVLDEDKNEKHILNLNYEDYEKAVTGNYFFYFVLHFCELK